MISGCIENQRLPNHSEGQYVQCCSKCFARGGATRKRNTRNSEHWAVFASDLQYFIKNKNVLVFQDLLHYCQDVYPGFPGRFRVRRKPRDTQIIARAHIFNVSVHASLLSGQLGNVTVATLHIEQSPRLIYNILQKNYTHVVVFQDLLHYCQDVYGFPRWFPGASKTPRNPNHSEGTYVQCFSECFVTLGATRKGNNRHSAHWAVFASDL